MSINLLAILGGITGISGVAAAPVTSVTNSVKAQDLNSFPINFKQTLTPGATANIPLGLVWGKAVELKNRAESNNWKEWGYKDASFLASGRSASGITIVDFDIANAGTILAPFIANLEAVAHGTRTDAQAKQIGVFSTKVISDEDDFLVVQLYYVDLLGEDILLMESDPISPEALGTTLSFGGNITTTDFHS